MKLRACRRARPSRCSLEAAACALSMMVKPGHVPASTWVVVSRLANPKWVVEMETVASKA